MSATTPGPVHATRFCVVEFLRDFPLRKPKNPEGEFGSFCGRSFTLINIGEQIYKLRNFNKLRQAAEKKVEQKS